MPAPPCRIATVYCAGIVVIAFRWVKATPLWIAFVIGTRICVITAPGRMHAFSIDTGINGAGILVIAILGRVHACSTIERVDGTVIAVVAI